MQEVPKTPRGAEYRKQYPEQLKTKLVVPRDIEGFPNDKIFERARELEKHYSKFPWFVGIAPNGSRMKGYSELALPFRGGSDYDMILLVDAEKHTISNDELYYPGFHIHASYVTKNEMDKFLCSPDPGELFGIWNIFNFATGPRVKELRSTFKTILDVLPKDKQEAVISGLVEGFVRSERSRIEEMNERLHNRRGMLRRIFGKKVLLDDVLEKRRTLWRARIEKILNQTS